MRRRQAIQLSVGRRVDAVLGCALLGCALLGSAAALAQGSKQTVPADLLIPRPPPSAPLSDWVDSETHARTSVRVADAELRGWDYPAPGARAKTGEVEGMAAGTPVVLFFNGNGMTVDRADPLYRSLEHAGAEVIAYDYRGVGFSSGKPEVMAFRQDALKVYDTVVAEHPGRPVVVYGFSLGTAMASYVASERPVAGLILAGTIATAAAEFPVYMRASGVDPGLTATLAPGPDAVEAFNEVGNVRRSHAPLLMLHGEADTLVPIAQGREVFAASASAKKRFVALPEVTHNGTAGAAESLDAVRSFLRGLGSNR